MSDDIAKLQMEIQQYLLDTFENIESGGGYVGYVDINNDFYMNANVMLTVAEIIKFQAAQSNDEDISYVLHMAALTVAEGIRMANQHVVGIDVDTMFD